MDNNIYEKGWEHVNSYIFGLIMSDGCLMREGRNKTALAIRICLNEKHIIQKLHEYMCDGNKIYVEGKQYSIKYRNKEAIDFLMENGLVERKSLIMQFPKIPDEFVGSFIRGYFDGDGSIVLRKTKYNVYGQVSFTSGSPDFLKTLQEKLSSVFSIKSQIYNDGRDNNKSMYLKITSRANIELFVKEIYKHNDICFDRKFEKFVELLENKPKYKITHTH